MEKSKDLNVVVIGAGPAGLSAAYRLIAAGCKVTILEADPDYVGGLAKTIRHGKCRYDLGGHRFFTKSAEVDEFWHHLLRDELLQVSRSSSIMYDGCFYSYPLDFSDVFLKFGFIRSARSLLSLIIARVINRRNIVTFEDWIVRNFGRYLYSIFFKTYTEKVWGLKGDEISADWAAQRIQGVSILSIVKSFFLKKTTKGGSPKSLITHFDYPRLGAGQMWERLAVIIVEKGGVIQKGKIVEKITYQGSADIRIKAIDTKTDQQSDFSCNFVVSTMPLGNLATSLIPAAPAVVVKAANELDHRDMIVVFLSIRNCPRLDEQWIYVHSPHLLVGRIQNLAAWSADLIGEESTYTYTLEYFVNHNDSFWTKADGEIINLAYDELREIPGLKDAALVEGHVTRVSKAYPVYNGNYQTNIAIIRGYLKQFEPSIQLAGRNGLHRYNNQDHSVMTGFLAAQNIIENWQCYDVWKVNQDAQYLEGSTELATTSIFPTSLK